MMRTMYTDTLGVELLKLGSSACVSDVPLTNFDVAIIINDGNLTFKSVETFDGVIYQYYVAKGHFLMKE